MANELSGSNWSGTPISNSNTSPNGWPEGMAPNGVNDSDREFAAAVKRHWDRINPTLTSGGSAGAYTLTPTVALGSYVHGEIFSFKANFTSVGADTLNISALGGKGFYKPGASGPTAIGAGDIVTNQDVVAAYDSALNSSAGGFQVLSALPPTANLTYILRSTKTSGYTAVAADQGKLIEATSGTFTLAFTAAATLGNGWWCYFKNSGTGDITLDPNASETIDGLTSFKAYSNEARLIYCDGSGFFSTVLNPLAIDVLATKTLTIPPGYSHFRGLLWGAGGGGRTGASAAAGGGGGGACVPYEFTAAQFGTAGTTITATLGAGGTPGVAGGNSTLGALVTAYGGASTANANGGGGGGAIGAGSTTTGGGPLGSAVLTDNSGFGGAGGGNGGGGGGNSAFGGGGGGSGSGATGFTGGASVNGGGGGGGVGSTNTAAGGASIHGGNGATSSVAGTPTTASQPGGGGGASFSGTGGTGGAGQCRLIGVI